MLVVDEAHRAQGDYAYCQVVRELVRSGGMFRVCGKRYNLFLEFLFLYLELFFKRYVVLYVYVAGFFDHLNK